MFPGMGGMNPRQMQQMMKQLGIKSSELDAKKVTIELKNGNNIVFDEPSVSAIDMHGKKTYTLMGSEREEKGISEEDVKIVAEQTGAAEKEARKALEETGDLAEAIMKLKK